MAFILFETTLVTVEEADALLEGSDEWSGLTTAEKQSRLREATKTLDDQPWLSVAVSADQPLNWPRVAFTYYDTSKGLLVVVPEGTVPRRVKLAVVELALHFTLYPSATKGFDATWDSISVGPISLSNANASSDPGTVPRVPASISLMLAPLLASGLGSPGNLAWWRAN